MEIEIHTASSRGISDIDWLHSRFSFSFADYHNPDRMNFGVLRVLNDDIFEGGGGFDMHPHSNFEIVTIVLDGSLEHKDSMGGHGVIKTNEVQHISAGSGISHSEYNASTKEQVSLLQIWVEPKERGIKPSYEQKSFVKINFTDRLVTLVSGKKDGDYLYMHQNGSFSLGEISRSKKIDYQLGWKGNGVYLFVISGKIALHSGEDKIELRTRDAAGITKTGKISFSALEKAKVLLIEVPMK